MNSTSRSNGSTTFAYAGNGIRDWMKGIPAGWEFKRAKYYLHEIDFRSTTGEEELLSVSHLTGVTPRSEKNVTMFEAETYAGSKLCWPGDLVINTMWAWMAALGVSQYHGIVSPSYGVYRLIEHDSFNPRYLDFLLRTIPYASEYFCRSTGIRDSRLRLYPDEFLKIPLLCPPGNTQDAIVAHLDIKLQEIDRFIANKQRLIQLLEEERSIVRRRAIMVETGPYKDSGILWLPRIPTRWRRGRIKTEFDNLNTRRIPLSSSDRGLMTERQYDYYGASGVIDKVDDYLFDEDLILVAEDGANLVLRNLRLAIIARGKYWVNNHAHILRPKRGDLFFWAELLELIDYKPWITGAAQPKLTQDRLMSIDLPVPPVEEQKAITEHLRAEYGRIDKGRHTIDRELELMNELRASLITEVVIGQIDVRAAT